MRPAPLGVARLAARGSRTQPTVPFVSHAKQPDGALYVRAPNVQRRRGFARADVHQSAFVDLDLAVPDS